MAVGAGYTLLKARALGDLAVFLDFGLLGAAGAWIVQTGSFSWLPVLWTVPMAMLVIAILHANNWRDIASDGERRVSTVAGRLGDRGSLAYYGVLIFGPVLIDLAFIALPRLARGPLRPMPWTFLLVLLALPNALRLWGRAVRRPPPARPSISSSSTARRPATISSSACSARRPLFSKGSCGGGERGPSGPGPPHGRRGGDPGRRSVHRPVQAPAPGPARLLGLAGRECHPRLGRRLRPRPGLRAPPPPRSARGPLRKAALGVLSAAALYAVFAAGRIAALRLFPFAGAEIGNVYALKAGVPVLRVALLIGLVIGPGEELFWRGFFQERVAATTKPLFGFVLTAMLYTAVHLAGGNIMLVLAAAVCGVFWGWLYLRFRSPVLNIVSHTLWDLAVFVIFPF